MSDLEFTLICKVKFYKNKRRTVPDLMSGNYITDIMIKGETEYLGFYFEQGLVLGFEEEVECCLLPINESVDYSNLKEGSEFFIMEASHKVGEGIVDTIFEHQRIRKSKRNKREKF